MCNNFNNSVTVAQNFSYNRILFMNQRISSYKANELGCSFPKNTLKRFIKKRLSLQGIKIPFDSSVLTGRVMFT